jgi:hypothetical protein
MSVQQSFPDAIVFPDGTIRVVTSAAKLWTYTNTAIRSSCTASTVPNYIESEDSVAEAMEEAGLTVIREEMPVSHYRSKRRRWPQTTTFDDTTVIKFRDRIPEEKRDDAMCRAYGRHRARNWRRMQERDEKRKEAQQPEEE